jgi:glycosyltransferase involved in cell wall biosynthesis
MGPRIGIFYKNFSAWKGISHIGLGVAAINNTNYLNSNSINAAVFPVRHNIDIVQAIKEYETENKYSLTHAVISAPWISTRDMKAIVEYFPMTQFVVVSHSNVGFLQADPQGIHLIRDYLELSHKLDNLSIGGNSERFTNWLSKAYNTHAVLLPNMYPISSSFLQHVKASIKRNFRDIVKIGSFGAIRPLKNQLTACAASIIIAKKLDKPVEFHLSAGREEGGGNIVLNAIKQMVQDIPNFELKLDGWCGWTDFRKTVADMDLLIHPSYTESFNMVSADGISQGVPVVGSSAIEWLPEHWKADSDDAMEIAQVGLNLLNSGAKDGLQALEAHNKDGFQHWGQFLKS